MAFWSVREELSQVNRLRRSYYELLRDELDQYLLRYSLLDSYSNFLTQNIPYPFVEKRELKPRARIPGVEYEQQNSILLIFVEDTIADNHKKYIRFFDDNRAIKKNLHRPEVMPLSVKYDRTHKYLESVHFFDFLKDLLPVDYALLIQRDESSVDRSRYCLSHFHVRIDWPIANAAEDLALALRYISKDIYEKGDKYAEDVQKKFFEYYGVPFMVGGRRTAAIVAAQYLKRLGCITTIYAGSSESRTLIRISERGVSKALLMKFSDSELNAIAKAQDIGPRTLRKHYVVTREKKDNVCILQATYAFTDHARPPDDGKLREIKPDLSWLSVGAEHLVPLPGEWKYPPIPINVIYT